MKKTRERSTGNGASEILGQPGMLRNAFPRSLPTLLAKAESKLAAARLRRTGAGRSALDALGAVCSEKRAPR
jgi:hypothetical protein